MNEGVDLSDHVEIRYNGMTQWDCQMVANGPDSAIDSKVGAMDLNSELTSTWKGDPLQQEPADETNGYAQTGIVGAKGRDEKMPKHVHKYRFLGKMFLRGDSVILVVKIGGQTFPWVTSLSWPSMT